MPVPWYEDWFDSDLYEVVYRSRDERDAERLTDLIVRVAEPEPGAEILDVGTGRGRHARVFARRGYHVTGLDLSPRAVETARQRAAAEELADRTAFVTGDMRVPLFRDRFSGVVNLFSSFGYFEREADHGRAVCAMAAALRRGGWMVQDLLNPAYLRAHLVPEDEREADGVHVRQQRRLVDGPRVEKTITLTPADGGEPYVTTESVRLLSREEMAALYQTAGLEVVGTYGDYGGGPYTDESPRLILHARRA